MIFLLQLHAKEHDDATLMVKIMDVLQKNSLPLQPGTADIVFRYNKSVAFSYHSFLDIMHVLNYILVQEIT